MSNRLFTAMKGAACRRSGFARVLIAAFAVFALIAAQLPAVASSSRPSENGILKLAKELQLSQAEANALFCSHSDAPKDNGSSGTHCPCPLCHGVSCCHAIVPHVEIGSVGAPQLRLRFSEEADLEPHALLNPKAKPRAPPA